MSLDPGSARVGVRDRMLRLLQIRPKTITDVRYTGKPAAKSAVAGDIYGHTSDDTARTVVEGLARQLGLLD